MCTSVNSSLTAGIFTKRLFTGLYKQASQVPKLRAQTPLLCRADMVTTKIMAITSFTPVTAART